MRDMRARLRGIVPLLLLAVVVLLTVFGLARGLWLENVHNAALAVTFTSVGAYVLFERPRHREGALFLATGTVHAVMFLGRQVGHFTPDASPWWGWLGVWPLPAALALTTFAVLCFPDGRLPSPRWRPVAVLIVADTVFLTVLSAGWPVDYASTGVGMPHPLGLRSSALLDVVWEAVAYPSFIAFQMLWIVAIIARWRRRDGAGRRALAWLAAAAAVSVVLLVTGLVVWGSPRAGILSATLLPLAAGWAIVHRQHVAAYSALSWLSREAADARELPGRLAEALAESTDAARVTVWLGDADRLVLVGVWPTGGRAGSVADLSSAVDLRPVERSGRVIGAIALERADPLSRSESRLFDDLASQAGLVLEHLTLAGVIDERRRAGALEKLTPREREVLELLAEGLSNAAICDRLHLSIKTVEPIVGAVFGKLGLQADAGSNRRVLAALEYLRAR